MVNTMGFFVSFFRFFYFFLFSCFLFILLHSFPFLISCFYLFIYLRFKKICLVYFSKSNVCFYDVCYVYQFLIFILISWASFIHFSFVFGFKICTVVLCLMFIYSSSESRLIGMPWLRFVCKF